MPTFLLRRCAALLAAALCFAVQPSSFEPSTAWAYTAGSGADGSVTIPTYADVAAYLARTDTSPVNYVQIGSYVYPEGFIRVDGLTDATLVQSYANVAAWKADANRGDKLFAVIAGNLYHVDHLEAFNDAGILTDSNLPSVEDQTPDPLTTAVGDDADAGGYAATAVGEGAVANGDGATAVGTWTHAEAFATSVGNEARAGGEGSVAIGDYAHAYSYGAVAIGAHSTTYGDRAVSLGDSARAIGSSAMALGRNAVAARLDIGQSLNEAIPDGATELLRCVNGVHGDPVNANEFEGWIVWCDQYLTDAEKTNSDLAAATAAGRTLRQGILTRLQGELDGFQVNYATAIGAYARATGDYATAVGHDAEAAGERSTALGYYAGALAARTTALGRHTRVYDERSTGVGSYTMVKGARATAVGAAAVAHGDRATAVGYYGHAMGEGALAIGQGAEAAKVPAGQYIYQVLPGGDDADPGWIAECAYDPWYENTPTGLKEHCDPFLTTAERNNANLDADSAAGRALRTAIRTRLAGVLDDLDVRQATAVGLEARATADWATALGAYAQAVGAEATAIGTASVAGRDATALGEVAYATADRSMALGRYAQAHGENTIAVGTNAIAGGLSAAGSPSTGWTYPTLEIYLADADRTTHTNALIGGKVYSVAALENVHSTAPGGLTRDNLPAPLVGQAGAIAIGHESRAAGADSIAFGRGARASGAGGIAIGADVTAAADQVVIGGSGHSYVLPGLAASQGADSEVLTVGANGVLATDGGALHRRVGMSGDAAASDGSAFARIADLQDGLGTDAASSDREGNAYERIKALRDVIDTATSEEFAAIGRANVLEQVDALDAGEVAKVVREVDAGSRAQTVKIRTGSGQERTVVTLSGASNQQIMALVALLTDTRVSTTPVLGEDGKPIGTGMAEFLTLDAEKALAEAEDETLTPAQRAANAAAATERLAYLFQALYGAPYGETGVADSATDSDNPHAQSIAGRLDSIDEFMPRGEDGALEEAPVDANGVVPEDVVRRVVVQDVWTENGRQRVVLRSVDLGQLAGVDRRVGALDRRVDGLERGLSSLSERNDKAIAMTSALTALPNVVPGANQFYLGAGTGFYRGEQAFALGLAVRLEALESGEDVYVNAGFASGYTGNGFTGRIGMGVAW